MFLLLNNRVFLKITQKESKKNYELNGKKNIYIDIVHGVSVYTDLQSFIQSNIVKSNSCLIILHPSNEHIQI